MSAIDFAADGNGGFHLLAASHSGGPVYLYRIDPEGRLTPRTRYSLSEGGT